MLHLSLSLRALIFVMLLTAVAVTGSDVAQGAPSLSNLTADNLLTFTSTGTNVAHDINVNNSDGGLRFYACPTLSNPPTCAAIQFFGNGANVFGGQAFIDSGASNNAALIFRTAQSSQAVGERMRIDAVGRVLVGPASNVLCDGPGDICADDDLVTDDDVHAGSSVFAGSDVRAGSRIFAGATTPSGCNSGGDVCAVDEVIAGTRMKAGSVEAGFCSAGGNICAGNSLVADDFVSAGANVGSCASGQVCAEDKILAGSASSGNCADAGDICAGDDLVSDEDVIVGSNCVRNANLTQLAGTCSSDVRLKMNVEPLPALLDALVALRPVTFDWRRDEFPGLQLGTERDWGLVAQDVEQFLPELVGEDKHGFKVVHYERLPLLLLQGMRELKVENDALRAQLAANEPQTRIAALEEQNDELSRQNAALEARLAAIEHLLSGNATLVAAR